MALDRRTFAIRAAGAALTFGLTTRAAWPMRAHDARIGLGTVIFRNRFEQTKPKDVVERHAALSLLDVPAYYRERFGLGNLEFWSKHFASLERDYLEILRARIVAAKSRLINIQLDGAYDLASLDETERRRSVGHARQWIDAAARLGSRAIRINPGRPGSSIERSIASLQELNQDCRSKGLKLLTENHFGIEMDPDVHLRIRAGAGPRNSYTDPDFGNYPPETMWESLAKILPYAYVVSAKTVDFDANGRHVSYDFDRCVRLCERSGFRGIYLVEQWSRQEQELDSEKIADWMIERVRANL